MQAAKIESTGTDGDRMHWCVRQSVLAWMSGLHFEIWKYFSIRSFLYSALKSKHISKRNKRVVKCSLVLYHISTQQSHTTLLIKCFWDFSYSWCLSWTLFSVIQYQCAYFAKNQIYALSVTGADRILYSLKQ